MLASDMKKKPLTSDRQPGAVPEIQSLNGSVTYVFAPARPGEQAHLVIRHDSDGNVWASISGNRRLMDE
jgi:hypothetical protein